MKYMVTGGVASVIYGGPRFTRYIDIVLSLTGSDVDRFSFLFSEDDFCVPPLETLRLEAGRERYGHFNVIHRDTALRADIYLLGSDPLHARGFERRTSLPVGEHSISIASIKEGSGSEAHRSGAGDPGPLTQFGAAAPSPEPYPSISMTFTISWLSVSMTTTVPGRALSPRSYRGVYVWPNLLSPSSVSRFRLEI